MNKRKKDFRGVLFLSFRVPGSTCFTRHPRLKGPRKLWQVYKFQHGARRRLGRWKKCCSCLPWVHCEARVGGPAEICCWTGCCRGHNTHRLAASMVDNIYKSGSRVDRGCIRVYPYSTSLVTVRDFRLSYEFRDGALVDALSNLGEVLSCVQETSSVPGLAKIKTGVRRLLMKLDSEVPVLLPVKGVQVLVSIVGRPPRCAKCLQPGHVRGNALLHVVYTVVSTVTSSSSVKT